MNAKDAIKKYIENELVKDKAHSELGESDPLIESGILDSLGIMKLMGFLEDELSITVDDDELIPENFETLQSITSLVEKKAAC